MNFFELRGRCIGQADKTFDAICTDAAQHVAAVKAIRLIIDSTFAERDGDEQSAKLLVNSALVVAGEAFGSSAQAKWVLLNQMGGMAVECIDAFDANNAGWVHVLAKKGDDKCPIAGIIDGFIRKMNSSQFDEEEKMRLAVLGLKGQCERCERKCKIAHVIQNVGRWMIALGFAVGILLQMLDVDIGLLGCAIVAAVFGGLAMNVIVADKAKSHKTKLQMLQKEYEEKMQTYEKPMEPVF